MTKLTEEQCKVLQKAVYGEHFHTWKWIPGGGWKCACEIDIYGKDNLSYQAIIPRPKNRSFVIPQEQWDCLKFAHLMPDYESFFDAAIKKFGNEIKAAVRMPHFFIWFTNNIPRLLADFLIEKG